MGSPSSVGGSLESRALDSKVLALELLLGQLETSGNSFRMGDKFIFAIKNYLCDSLIRNISLVGPTLVVNLSLRIFVALITHFKDNLKSEIEVFISSMFLPILEAASAVYEHRMLVLEVFARLCQDSYTVVELFINYDCSDDLSNESGVFERIVGAISKIAQTDCTGDPNANAVRKARAMRLLALRSLVSITKCMAEFTDVSGTGSGGPDQNNNRKRKNSSELSTVEEESAAGDETFDATLVSSDYEDDETNNTASQGTVLVSSVDTFDKKQRRRCLLSLTNFDAKPKMASATSYAGILEPYSEPSRTNEDGTKTPAKMELKSSLLHWPSPRRQSGPASRAIRCLWPTFCTALLKEEKLSWTRGKSEIIWAKLMTTTWLCLRRIVSQWYSKTWRLTRGFGIF